MLTFSPSPNQILFNVVNLFLQHLAQQGPECWSPAALCFLMRTLGEQRQKPDDVLRLCASLAGWRSWTTSWTTSLRHSNEAWLTDWLTVFGCDGLRCSERSSCQFNLRLLPLHVTQQQLKGSVFLWPWLCSSAIEGRKMMDASVCPFSMSVSPALAVTQLDEVPMCSLLFKCLLAWNRTYCTYLFVYLYEI